MEGAPVRSFADQADIDVFLRNAGSSAISQYLATDSPSLRKSLRNNIVLNRMYVIDRNYSNFERNLTRERQDIGFYSAVALLGLNTTGTLVGGSEAKAILHAVSAGVTGTTEAYGNEILIEKTIDILQKNMRANRTEVQNQILTSLTKSASQYPLQLALSDVDRYFDAGTITGAFLGASNAATVRLENAEFDAQIARKNTFSISSSGELIAVYARKSTANQNRVVAWIKVNADGVPWATFVRSAKYKPLHSRLIDDLNIQ